MSKREEVLKIAERVTNEVGHVTILINNAGIMPCRPLLSQKPDHINQVFNVNVLSNFWVSIEIKANKSQLVSYIFLK